MEYYSIKMQRYWQRSTRNYKENSEKKDQILGELCEEKRTIRNDIETQRNNLDEIEKIKEVRKNIRKRKRELEEKEITSKLTRIENTKNDSNRYFIVMKELNIKRKKKPLKLSDSDNHLLTGEHEQAEY